MSVLSAGRGRGNGIGPVGRAAMASPATMAVIASAIAIGFLTVPLLMRVNRRYIDLCAAILLLEAGVGLWGFVLHTAANLQGPSIHAFDNFIYGAPPMAPLLFPNLMLLGIIGLWQMRAGLSDSTLSESHA